MNDQLEALLALWKQGTMNAAATRLRLTPSAVSKRIDSLQNQVGYALIEPHGRNVELTPAGLRLVSRVEPILSQLRHVLTDERTVEGGSVSMGVTESVLASWGAGLVSRAAKKIPQVRLQIHSHRSPVVMEKVRSGELAIGLCAGISESTDDLRVELLCREEMVIVPSGLEPLRLSKSEPLAVMSIESHAMTWDSLQRQLRQLKSKKEITIEITQELQSFTCVAQLAKAGHAHGLVPLGVVKALGISETKILRLPGAGLRRPVSLVSKTSSLARESVQELHNQLFALAKELP